ncbi:MAG: hypothetical protein A3I71_06080 [Omnitrophica WOR_2 bacterium RIFCSPLOWO2_02_FULL_63_16]|nr:MAG: hypothetical protein A3I71_06080 [Omnitrophica WOR_2 bacterium RIFCSPLOWO2_02_FULL_63_16]
MRRGWRSKEPDMPLQPMSPGNGRKHEDFRVLFLYPNIQMCALMPSGIALLSAMLKREGFTVDLFDCTFYQNPLNANFPFYHASLRPVNWEEKGVRFFQSDLAADLQRKVDQFGPNLIAVSVVENTYEIGLRLVKSLRQRIPTVFGGVFATYAPEKIIKEEVVDFVCRGEGEEALVDLCIRLCRGLPVEDTPNMFVKMDGRVVQNLIRPTIDLNTLPFPDFDLFDPQSIYRPMQGKIWRTIGVETQRGCPFTCAYCNSPSNNQAYTADKSGKFYRKKRLERVREELNWLVKRYQPELIYFVVDTFLAMSDDEFHELARMYLDFRIAFWMNTRCETITPERAEWLERMNCLRMSMGIEHGNPAYRDQMLKRRVSNERMLDAFRAVAGRRYAVNGNSIVGMPGETRELAFDTIRFNRQLPKEIESSGAFIFAPCHGTSLREIAIREGYLDPESIVSLSHDAGSMLDMPQFRREEIIGLARTFSLYVKLPETSYPEIRIAERVDGVGDRHYESLLKRFREETYGVGALDPIDS